MFLYLGRGEGVGSCITSLEILYIKMSRNRFSQQNEIWENAIILGDFHPRLHKAHSH